MAVMAAKKMIVGRIVMAKAGANVPMLTTSPVSGSVPLSRMPSPPEGI